MNSQTLNIEYPIVKSHVIECYGSLYYEAHQENQVKGKF